MVFQWCSSGVFQMWPDWAGPSGWAGAGMREKKGQRTGRRCPRHRIRFCSWLLWRRGGGEEGSAGPGRREQALGHHGWSPASADVAPHDLGCSSQGFLEAGGGCGPAQSRCSPGEPREVREKPQPGPQLRGCSHKASGALRVHPPWPAGGPGPSPWPRPSSQGALLPRLLLSSFLAVCCRARHFCSFLQSCCGPPLPRFPLFSSSPRFLCRFPVLRQIAN